MGNSHDAHQCTIAPGGGQVGAAGRPGAFTLVELLIVMAIISLLVSLLLPSLGKAKLMAQRTVCGGNLRQISLAMEYYLDDNDRIYPCAQDPVSTDPFYWLWMGRGWRRFVGPYIDAGIDQQNPSVLFCPGDPVADNQYESTSYAYSMCFYHSDAQIDAAVSMEDTYKNAQSFVARRQEDVASPCRKIVIGEWNSNHYPVENDSGWWCWDGLRNFLRVDGSVAYTAASDIRAAMDGFPDANLTAGGLGGEDCYR